MHALPYALLVGYSQADILAHDRMSLVKLVRPGIVQDGVLMLALLL